MLLYQSHSLPSSLNTLFTTGNQIHTYDTRQAFDCRTHACRTSVKQFTILFRGYVDQLYLNMPTNSFQRKLIYKRGVITKYLQYYLY